MSHILVLIRHGESTWNRDNLFTGWTNVDLSDVGKDEALAAAKSFKEKGFKFDVVYTSVLKRATDTTSIILNEINQTDIPVHKSWRLNERHYGALQGLNKAETAKKYGEDQVKIWRRSYDIPPPPLDENDERWPGNDVLYSNVDKSDIPFHESLKDTVNRVLPLWTDEISLLVKSGKKVLISAHGNSLRGLVMHLDQLSDKEIIDFNIPTAVPLVYELDDTLKPIKRYYLLDEEALKEKIDAVAKQGKAK